MFRLVTLSIVLFFGASVLGSNIDLQPLTDLEYCGGSAQFIEMRVSRCTRQPCYFFGGIVYEIEIDFIPMRTTKNLQVVISTTSALDKSSAPVSYGAQFSGEFVGSLSYSLSYTLTPQETVGGMLLKTEIIGDGGRVEICRELQSIVYNFPAGI